jgi:hypothetical protein
MKIHALGIDLGKTVPGPCGVEPWTSTPSKKMLTNST